MYVELCSEILRPALLRISNRCQLTQVQQNLSTESIIADQTKQVGPDDILVGKLCLNLGRELEFNTEVVKGDLGRETSCNSWDGGYRSLLWLRLGVQLLDDLGKSFEVDSWRNLVYWLQYC